MARRSLLNAEAYVTNDETFRVAALFSDDSQALPKAASTSAPSSLPDASPSAADSGPIPSDDDISKLAHSGSTVNASITDRLLAQYSTSDLGDMSVKMTQLVSVSKGFDPKAAKHGLFQKALGAFRGEREQLLAHLQTVKQQVDGIVAELDQKVILHEQRIKDIAAMQQENLAYHATRQASVFQFNQWLASVTAALALPVDPNDGMAAAHVSALQHLNQRLQVAIADAQNAMLLAKQNAIKLQMTSDNSRAILDQFERVKVNVIPALKSLLEQQLLAMEQKKSIDVDNMLSSTLDAALRSNAQLTADNTVAIATMQQRSTVSVDTIAECQTILNETAGKVRDIEEAGRLHRIEDAAKRQTIEQDMLTLVAR
jgi:uncharacterized protein YaaN involved in tellurite resistance